ncbi:MAG: hypothetical protein NVV63_16885 [Opitutus sp.]|nr:hypothetical protein [Opitutus sp.]
MKFPSFLSHCVLALGLAAAANAQEVKLNQPADGANQEAAAQAPKFTEAQLVEEFGWFMAKRVGLSELDLTAEEIKVCCAAWPRRRKAKTRPSNSS